MVYRVRVNINLKGTSGTTNNIWCIILKPFLHFAGFLSVFNICVSFLWRLKFLFNAHEMGKNLTLLIYYTLTGTS